MESQSVQNNLLLFYFNLFLDPSGFCGILTHKKGNIVGVAGGQEIMGCA